MVLVKNLSIFVGVADDVNDIDDDDERTLVAIGVL